MGTTPKYALPYPELTDPTNVPNDVHALATGVEFVLSQVPISLPASQTKYRSADQTITATANGTPAPGLDQVAIRNPSSSAKMFARVSANGWASVAQPQSLYLAPIVKSGTPAPTSVFKSQARVEGTAANGGVYRDFFSEWNVYINAGVTCTFQLAAWKYTAGGAAAIIRYTSLSVIAISYTLDTLPPYDPQP